MCNAVDVMLSLQNPDGGFASYELIRGPAWLELLNPAEVFGQLSTLILVVQNFNHILFLLGNIMIEYNYPECTTSAITSLAIFRKHFPDYRAQNIE